MPTPDEQKPVDTKTTSEAAEIEEIDGLRAILFEAVRKGGFLTLDEVSALDDCLAWYQAALALKEMGAYKNPEDISFDLPFVADPSKAVLRADIAKQTATYTAGQAAEHKARVFDKIKDVLGVKE